MDLVNVWNSLWSYASNQGMEKQEQRLCVTNPDRKLHHKSIAIPGTGFWKQSYGKKSQKSSLTMLNIKHSHKWCQGNNSKHHHKACGGTGWEKNQLCELSKPVLEEVISHSLSPHLLKMPVEEGLKFCFRDWWRKSIEKSLNSNKTLK